MAKNERVGPAIHVSGASPLSTSGSFEEQDNEMSTSSVSDELNVTVINQEDTLLSVIIANLAVSARRKRNSPLMVHHSESSSQCTTPPVNIANLDGAVQSISDVWKKEDERKSKRSRSPAPANFLDYSLPPVKYRPVDQYRTPSRTPFHPRQMFKENFNPSSSKASSAKSTLTLGVAEFDDTPSQCVQVTEPPAVPPPTLSETVYNKNVFSSKPPFSSEKVMVFNVDGQNFKQRRSCKFSGNRKTIINSGSVPYFDESNGGSEVKPRRLGQYGVRNESCATKKASTVPIPFTFDARDTAMLEAKRARLTQDSGDDEYGVDRIHNARPASVLSRKPFVPCKSRKQPTQAVTPNLHTRVRAVQRQEFEDTLKMRQTKTEIIREQRAEAKRQQEEQEIRNLRKSLVHKARSVPHFKSHHIEKSTVPLTSPKTPTCFHKKSLFSFKNP